MEMKKLTPKFLLDEPYKSISKLMESLTAAGVDETKDWGQKFDDSGTSW